MERQSNIELCRIISMFLIVLLHSTFSAVGFPNGPIDANTCFLVVLYSVSIIGVDLFLLISGWFSINIKKKSVFNLLWICLFYGIIRVLFKIIQGESLKWSDFLFVSRSNWFVVSYIGLMIISPVLNQFVSSSSKKKLGGVIFTLLIFNIWFDIFPARADIPPGFYYGCSVIWFLEMYLIGRYYNIYGIPVFVKRYSLLLYLICSMIIFVLVLVSLKTFPSSKIPTLVGKIGAQNNPLIILSALSLFSYFQSLTFHSKICNYVARSTLAVLILHSSVINSLMKQFYIDLYSNSLSARFVCLWIMGVLGIYILAIIMDQIRILIFSKFFSLYGKKI